MTIQRKSDIRLEKALTSISSMLQLGQGGLGAYATSTLGAASSGQHLDSPRGNKSKKTKQEEDRLLPNKE